MKELGYPCEQCDHIATQSLFLKQHRESKHKGVRYPCDQCEYIATHSRNLKNHK